MVIRHLNGSRSINLENIQVSKTEAARKALKTLVADCARYIVLIDALENAVKFRNALLCLFQLFPAPLYRLFRFPIANIPYTKIPLWPVAPNALTYIVPPTPLNFSTKAAIF